ncbi:hypothetical protein N658DRAFT_174248 [Parathielavia hyrcaniae]|uniref:Uncharacterized protein n=1 Tax=Parathielavia hyrcaniae TaxID=113614 RepID=A0AAN6Q185_9PEZI|nr:hypothetical protein N658DRAFT_174248 [Parathielavia hyrcaniae]
MYPCTMSGKAEAACIYIGHLRASARSAGQSLCGWLILALPEQSSVANSASGDSARQVFEAAADGSAYCLIESFSHRISSPASVWINPVHRSHGWRSPSLAGCLHCFRIWPGYLSSDVNKDQGASQDTTNGSRQWWPKTRRLPL